MRILGTTLGWPRPLGRRVALPGVARLLALVLLALPLVACDFLTGVPSVGRVEVTVAPTTLSINQVTVASGIAYNRDGDVIRNQRRAVTFRSSNPSVASINATTGQIVALANGTTEITGESGGRTSPPVLVTVRPVPVRQVVLTPRNLVLRVGVPFLGLGAVALDSVNQPIRDRSITYTSRDPAVVEVSAAGVLTPRAVGSTQVIASVDGGARADTATVRVTPVPITSVRVEPQDPFTLYVGETRQLTATLRDSIGTIVTGRPVTWRANDPLAVRIDANGLVTALAPTGSNGTGVFAQVEAVPEFNPLVAGGTSAIVLARASFITCTSALTIPSGQQRQASLLVNSGDQPTPITGARVTVTSDNPAVVTPASVEVTSASTGTGVVFTAGTVTSTQIVTVTYQAIRVDNNQPQGTSCRTTVTVNP